MIKPEICYAIEFPLLKLKYIKLTIRSDWEKQNDSNLMKNNWFFS